MAYNPDDDEYLVLWEDYRNGTSNPDIYGQRVVGDGLLAGGSITVTTALYRQIEPRIAYGNGRYLVAWQHYPGSGGTNYDAYARLHTADGSLDSEPLPVANSLYKESPTGVVFNSASGKFLVLWQQVHRYLGHPGPACHYWRSAGEPLRRGHERERGTGRRGEL